MNLLFISFLGYGRCAVEFKYNDKYENGHGQDCLNGAGPSYGLF